jgi:hypothetical protein
MTVVGTQGKGNWGGMRGVAGGGGDDEGSYEILAKVLQDTDEAFLCWHKCSLCKTTHNSENSYGKWKMFIEYDLG